MWIPFYYNKSISKSIYGDIDKIIKEVSKETSLNSKWLIENLDETYFLKEETIKDLGIKMKDSITLRKILNKIYKKYGAIIKGKKEDSDESGSNINSLVIYSGPSEISNNYNMRSYVECYHISTEEIVLNHQKLGCLFCGDYNSKQENSYQKISNFIMRHHKHIGVIQIPHHGSRKNYHIGLEKGIPISLISFGEINKYGHPDWVVYKNLNNNPFTRFIYVTDDDKSKFIQDMVIETISMQLWQE